MPSNGRTIRSIIPPSVPVLALALVLVLASFGTDTAAFSPTSTTSNLSGSARNANRCRGARVSHPHRPVCSVSALPGNGNDNDNDSDKSEWTPNDLFESIKNFFQPGDKKSDENEGGTDTPSTSSSFSSSSSLSSSTSQFFRAGSGNNYVDDTDEDEDDLPAGTSLLLRIPAKQLKPGGLRLFLMFYLMGMQNTPDPNTWRADQKLMSVNVSPRTLPNGMIVSGGGGEGSENYRESEDDEKKYVLEMLYDKDRTGMLQIELLPNERVAKQPEIRIYRCGSRPSTSYLMQESLIVDGVLDELQNLSGGGSATSTTATGSDNNDEPEIADEDRLLIPDPETAIVEARDSLAFG